MATYSVTCLKPAPPAASLTLQLTFELSLPGMRCTVTVVTGAAASTFCSSTRVSSGAWVSNSTRALALTTPSGRTEAGALAGSVTLSGERAFTVYETKPAPLPVASLGASRPRVLSCSTSPVSGSIACSSQDTPAGSWNRSMPAETRSTKPRVATKSKSPW